MYKKCESGRQRCLQTSAAYKLETAQEEFEDQEFSLGHLLLRLDELNLRSLRDLDLRALSRGFQSNRSV